MGDKERESKVNRERYRIKTVRGKEREGVLSRNLTGRRYGKGKANVTNLFKRTFFLVLYGQVFSNKLFPAARSSF